MTTVQDLIAMLQTRNPDAQVFLMTQRKQPFENHLAGVVGREEMPDQQWREEPGIACDDVFLVVGKRIRPGSLSAWIVAEHRAANPARPIARPLIAVNGNAEQPAQGVNELLAEIAAMHLAVHDLEEEDDAHVFALSAPEIRRALEAAYAAGRASCAGSAVPPVTPNAPADGAPEIETDAEVEPDDSDAAEPAPSDRW